MSFSKSNSLVYFPDGNNDEQRVTHLCIAAHHDDIELMAYHGIGECFGREDKWFAGVVVTDGAGSPRDDLYSDFTDEDMKAIRVKEQIKAAVIGEYGVQYFLGYTSSEVKGGDDRVVDDIVKIIKATKPQVIYTHNPADKHDTHCAVMLRVISALRKISPSDRPTLLLGCEVWRDLDWVVDEQKTVLDCSAHPNISRALVSVFDSQICGGKRYDLACDGRRVANATYFASHSTDSAQMLNYAIDMTSLMNSNQSVSDFIFEYINSFKNDVSARLNKLSK